jgi:hypothetical protein
MTEKNMSEPIWNYSEELSGENGKLITRYFKHDDSGWLEHCAKVCAGQAKLGDYKMCADPRARLIQISESEYRAARAERT